MAEILKEKLTELSELEGLPHSSPSPELTEAGAHQENRCLSLTWIVRANQKLLKATPSELKQDLSQSFESLFKESFHGHNS